MIPEKIGCYKILKELGNGGFGIVYLGEHEINKQKAAIKIAKGNYHNALKAEAKIWSDLNHEHIARLMYCDYLEEDKIYLAIQYIHGGSLRDSLTKEETPLLEKIRLLVQIGNALVYLHDKELIHLDITPKNILVDEKGNAFLTDFGLSKHAKDRAKGGGTKNYMSPEQRTGNYGSIGPKSDIYSFGVVAHELIHGVRPGVNINKKLDLSRADLETIKKIDSLIENALRKDPTERPGSPQLLRSLIEIEEAYYKSADDNSNLSQEDQKQNTLEENSQKSNMAQKTSSAVTAIKIDRSWTSDFQAHVAACDLLNDTDFHTVFNKFSKLMEYTAVIPADAANEMKNKGISLCQYLLNRILESRTGDIKILVYGPPGTGKSSILSMLALAAKRACHSDPNNKEITVDYVNIHDFDEIRAGSLNSNKKAVINRFTEIRDVLSSRFPDSRGILFVDGIEHHKRDRVPDTQKKFVEFYENIKGLKIIGVGEFDDLEFVESNTAKYAEDLDFKATKLSLQLKMQSVEAPDFDGFCQAFIDFHKSINSFNRDWSYPPVSAETLTNRLKKLGMKRIDLLRLDILASTDDAHSDSLSLALDFFCKRYFRNYFAKLSPGLGVDTDERIREAADCVFRIWVCKDLQIQKRFEIPCWGFVTGHPAIRNYFIAYHIIESMYEIGERLSKPKTKSRGSKPYDAEKAFVDYGLKSKLYPFDVNTHCKFLLNKDVSKRDMIIRAIEYLFKSTRRELKGTAAIHLCYLIGRVVGKEQQAIKILNEFEKKRGLRKGSAKGPDSLPMDKHGDYLLECTVLISKTRLDPNNCRSYTEQFLEGLNSNKDWASNALGFHLMYYGDYFFDYEFSRSPLSVPDGVPYVKTIDVIEPRIFATLDTQGKLYPLFEIDVSILSLLLISRQHSEDVFTNPQLVECRSRARDILMRVCESHNTHVKNSVVLPFAQFSLNYTRREESISAMDLITKFYECKHDTQRAGWLKRLGVIGRIESVADHSWGAMLLAEILLPRVLPFLDEGGSAELNSQYKGYDKAEIIRTLLIHDLAESYTGDLPLETSEQDNHRKKGSHFIDSIYFLRTSDSGRANQIVYGFEDLVKRWRAIEKRRDINGRFAHFFNKLDAFLQIVVYSKLYFTQRQKEETKAKWDRFFNTLKDELSSSAEDIQFLRSLSNTIIAWGVCIFGNNKAYLPHDEVFNEYSKYYPVRDSDGVYVAINKENHSDVSLDRDNTSVQVRDE